MGQKLSTAARWSIGLPVDPVNHSWRVVAAQPPLLLPSGWADDVYRALSPRKMLLISYPNFSLSTTLKSGEFFTLFLLCITPILASTNG